MTTTTNFALRTFPEFKEAAKSLVGLNLYEWRPLPEDANTSGWYVDTGSINAAFNSLIAIGLPKMASIVDVELAKQQAALDTAQEIMRFVLDNPAARRAYAANFDEGSNGRRLLEGNDADRREAEENDGGVEVGAPGLTDADQALQFLMDETEDGISRQGAAWMLSKVQEKVSHLCDAKGAIQRAMATQREAGARAP